MVWCMSLSRTQVFLLGTTLSFGLACAGLDQPAPAPRPDPVGNATQCTTFRGTGLPMDPGVIVACSKKSVTIDHGEDGRPWRWKYLERYKAEGWTLSDPDSGNPVAVKGEHRLVFHASGNEVTIEVRK